jgi:cystathionine beta-synthase
MSTSPIFDSITDAVGNTPMVRLNRVCTEFPVEFLAKCEFLNPGGSVKDRIGVRMLVEAEKAGKIKPGDTLIEPTSGNTGIGIAMAAAARGYKLIITMPMKMSMEKQVVLEALGAKIVRTPTEAAHDSPDSLFGVAHRLLGEIPNSFMLDQYTNPDNPDAHYYGTGAEIVEQCEGQLDYCVISVGTGGTITGVARKLKEAIPNCKIIGVDPIGSILGGGEPGGPYFVEGIGYDFFPDVLDNSLVDEYVKTNDADSFYWARKIVRDEGLLVGGSSGAVLWAARQIAERCKGNERMVLVFADSVRNYLSKHLNDAWMAEKGFSIP